MSLRNYTLLSILFIFILGTLLHFTYEWSGGNSFVGVFSSVNESTWEHLKLLFFPMLITTIIGYFLFKNKYPNFLCPKVLGIVIALAFTIIFFYTYTGILGKNIPFIDISSFFVATIIGEISSYILIINKFKCNNVFATTFITIMIICFVIFTFSPLNIGLFRVP